MYWWRRWESNPRPFECHSNALPIELQPHICLLQVRLRILYRVSIPGIVRTVCSFPPILSQLVGIVGLEPTRPLGHQILSLTRLPIPSYPQIKRILGVCSPTQQHHWRFSVYSSEPDWIHLCMLNAPDRAALFHARESYGGFWQDPHRLSCFQVQI